mmetsp:Transcript_16589/g.23468  ORF Transcript_16589/g.23468 Transcript_16589/m.23468 type:complete len:80 (-) Transcript_16589:62-301(-)
METNLNLGTSVFTECFLAAAAVSDVVGDVKDWGARGADARLDCGGASFDSFAVGDGDDVPSFDGGTSSVADALSFAFIS